MARRPPGLTYSARHGWRGADTRTLYTITDTLTGRMIVRPGGELRGIGEDAQIRIATRSEAEEHWQRPLHAGWTVDDATSNPPRVYRAQKVVAKLDKDPRPSLQIGAIVSSPADLVRYTLADYLGGRADELFLVLFLNVKNHVVGYHEFAGGSSSVEVHPASIMRAAIGSGAEGFITVHNHPSGDPTPSDADRALWERLREVGKLMGVPVLDNLVIGDDGQYFSEMEGKAGRIRLPPKERS